MYVYKCARTHTHVSQQAHLLKFVGVGTAGTTCSGPHLNHLEPMQDFPGSNWSEATSRAITNCQILHPAEESLNIRSRRYGCWLWLWGL